MFKEIFEKLLAEIKGGEFLAYLTANKDRLIALICAFTEDQYQFILYVIARRYKQKSTEIFQVLMGLSKARRVLSFDMQVVFTTIKEARNVPTTPTFIHENKYHISARSALHHAIEKKSDAETIEILVQNGSPIHYQMILQRPNFRIEALTPIEFAILLKEELLMDTLIRLGADVKKGDGFNFPLLRACYAKSPSMIKKLVAAGADINQLSDPQCSLPPIANQPTRDCKHSSLTTLLEGGTYNSFNRAYHHLGDFSTAVETLLSFGHPSLNLAHNISHQPWDKNEQAGYVVPPTKEHIMPLDLVQYISKVLAEHQHLRSYKLLVEAAIARVISNRIVGIDRLLESVVANEYLIPIPPLRKLVLWYVGVDKELTKFGSKKPDSSNVNPAKELIAQKTLEPTQTSPVDPTTINLSDIETMLLPESTATTSGLATAATDTDNKSKAECSKPKAAVVFSNPSQRYIAETFQMLMDAKGEREKALLAASTAEWEHEGILMFFPSKPPKPKWFGLGQAMATSGTAATGTAAEGTAIGASIETAAAPAASVSSASTAIPPVPCSTGSAGSGGAAACDSIISSTKDIADDAQAYVYKM